MRFTKSLAAAGALGLAVLTAAPASADDIDGVPTESAVSTTEAQENLDAAFTESAADAPAEAPEAPAPAPEAERQSAADPEPAGPEPAPAPAQPEPAAEPAAEPAPAPAPAEITPAQPEESAPATGGSGPKTPPGDVVDVKRPLIDSAVVTPGAVVRGGAYTVTVRTSDVPNGARVFVRGIGGKSAAGLVRAGRAVVKLTVPVNTRLGEHTLRVSVTGAMPVNTWAVVKPAPVAALDLRLDPAKRLPGQSYQAVITTKKAKPGTVVTVKDPGGRAYRAKLDARGTARITLTVPKGTRPGRHAVSASLPDGACDSATLTVVKPAPRAGRIALDLTPDTITAGGKFTALVATTYVAPGTKVTIYDPAGKPFTVKVDKNGTAIKKFHVPSSTDAGSYWFTAKLPTGQKSSAKLTVLTWKASVSHGYTPRGGAQTGGGLAGRTLAAAPSATGGSTLGALVLGGSLLAGGSGAALFARRSGRQG
ncbi:hypothetical protein GCM10010466_47410 [Planomonospora alba]|uniref:Uncharacterized protein n=1 Tax=Planomonospora alba TaxID=161354 RepID=A0ABP6NLW5_9ACTN